MRFLRPTASALPPTAIPAPVNSGVVERSALPPIAVPGLDGVDNAVGIDQHQSSSIAMESKGLRSAPSANSGMLSARSDRSESSAVSPRTGMWATIGDGSNPFAAVVAAAKRERERQKRRAERERVRANSPAQQAHKSPRLWELSGNKLSKAVKEALKLQFVDDADGILGSLAPDGALAQVLNQGGILATSSMASIDPMHSIDASASLVRGGIRSWVTEGAGVLQLGIVGGINKRRLLRSDGSFDMDSPVAVMQ